MFNKKSTDNLFKGILSLENIEECYDFFKDLCTVKELIDIAQRFDVACQLADGKYYHQISEVTGASSATISRVNRCLHYGNNGYKKAIERISEKTEKNENDD